MLAYELPRQVLFTGAVTGVTYGMMAVGVVLVFRSTRVANFAVGEMGGFAAALLYRMVIDWDVPFWLSLVTCIAVGAVFGAAIELFVVRRLFDAPRVVLLVALIGVSQLLLFFQVILPRVRNVRPYPTPWSSRWEVAGVVVRSQELLALVVMPALVIALWFFLDRSKYGLAVRASAANADAARLAGVNIKRMSTLVWVIAGTLAALGAVLFAPLSPQGLSPTGLGPGLLLRVLAAALLAGMVSLPLALGAGLGIGVVESLVAFNHNEQRGLMELVLFLLVLGALFARRRGAAVEADRGRWSMAPRVRPVPAALEGLWWVRRLPALGGLMALLVALLPLLIIDLPSQRQAWTRVLLYALVALSLTVLTGWAGQLSLGQFAFAGLGGLTAAALMREGLGFVPALAAGALAAAAAALVVGIPALRRPGLFLAISSFAFAVATASWLLWRNVFLDGQRSVQVPRQVLPLPAFLFDEGLDLRAHGTYYAMCLAVLVVCIVAVARLQRTRLGTAMVAVRDNERAAASLGISPTRVKLVAFAIGGALAGLAGGLLVGLLREARPETFSASESLRVISIVVIGGLSSVVGAVLGAAWVVGLPVLFDGSVEVALLTSGAGLLVLLLYVPGGLVQVVYSVRDAGLAALARRRPEPPPRERSAALPVQPARAPRAPRVEASGGTVLAGTELTVRFGTVRALSDASIEVRRSEVVGLIGANGAGKTTLMNALCGFLPATGSVELLGRDVSRLAPERRARLGLARSWQGAELFPDLTVRQTVGLAVRGVRSWSTAVRPEADEAISFLGLGAFADRFVNELSTGTRRVVELACLVVSGAEVLCLDEPTAGLAQRESEAFGPLILRVREELDASVLIIEHDMPLILGISDRVYCLEAGRVISSGPPEQVRDDPLVIATYLGTDEVAIQRSGSRVSQGGQPRDQLVDE